MSERVTFSAKGGAQTNGELALPEGTGKAPALVLVQEYWGVNDHIKSLVDRFAKAGFMTLAPDLYQGRITKDAAEASKWMGELDGPRVIREIGGAVTFLLAHARSNGKVGITGFCVGGAYSFAAACHVPELSAVVPFYGIPPAANVDYSKVKAPILAHFASRDQWATVDKAEAIQKELAARGQPMELCIYDADHAFVNDTRPEVFAPEASNLAWERTTKFLHTHLG